MELGSNFDLDISDLCYKSNNVKEYLSENNAWYGNSGRAAIKKCIKQYEKGKVLLPSYICKSVIDCFEANFEIDFYRVNKNFEIDLTDLEKKLNDKITIVYLMHYFGKLQSEEVLNFLENKKRQLQFIILEDTTHCFLTRKKTIGDIQVCSLRKWFPIPDGGVAYSTKHKLIANEEDEDSFSARVTEAMILKFMAIHGEINKNELYRKRFSEYEQILNKQTDLYRVSKMAETIMDCMDLTDLIEKRKVNWNCVNTKLQNKKVIPVYNENAELFVPFTFPVWVEERDKLREYLIENHIFCAVHWPIEDERQTKVGNTTKISEHILSLPIDQRYDETYLEYMIEIINKYN